jgi:hypothetical protein
MAGFLFIYRVPDSAGKGTEIIFNATATVVTKVRKWMALDSWR